MESVKKRLGLLRPILEQRGVDAEKRMQLFGLESPDAISTGSLIRVQYYNNTPDPAETGHPSRPQQFVGVLLQVKRHALEPTFTVRGVVDGVGVEQVFCIHSPLIKEIQLLRANPRKSTRPLLVLRENPHRIANLVERHKNDPGKDLL